MVDRVKSIPLLSAVDIVMNESFIRNKELVRENIKRTGLKIALVAVDTFANPLYKQGSLSSIDKSIRERALSYCRDAVAESAEWLNCLENIIDNADMDQIKRVISSKDAIAVSRLMRGLVFNV